METDPVKSMLTPPQLAERWGVAADKVLYFIDSKQLVALDLSMKGERPRYRISWKEIRRFEKTRATTIRNVKKKKDAVMYVWNGVDGYDEVKRIPKGKSMR